MDDLLSVSRKLLMKHVRIASRAMHLPWKATNSRSEFEQQLTALSAEDRDNLCTRLSSLKSELDSRKKSRSDLKSHLKTELKRKRQEETFRLDAIKRLKKLEGRDESQCYVFPDIVDEEDQLRRLSMFNDCLRDSFMQQVVCASCAGKYDRQDTHQYDVEQIPHKHRLIPHMSHPAHELTDDLLLYPDAVLNSASNHKYTYLCSTCEDHLVHDRVPPLSLSNNMWIGRVPEELSILTILERLLVSLYYPFAYVIKLYPKSPNARFWKDWDVNFGVRGNVSTYKLDNVGISDMVRGHLMPHPPEILASVFTITLVGPKGRPDRALQGLCQVRRQRIVDALLWLKTNNPLYENILIDDSILDRLPNNSIPLSIEHNIKHIHSHVNANEYNVFLRSQEEEAEDEDDTCLTDGARSPCSTEIEEDDVLYQEPSVVPLQESAVVDIDGCGVSDLHLLQEALMNTDGRSVGDEPSYAVLRGNEFVNEYARKNDAGEEVSTHNNCPNHLLGAFPTLFPYGQGGFETERPYRVSYVQHSQWALRYADNRFAKNVNFISQVFGVMQKRQICLGADLQIKRRDFQNHQRAINGIKPSDLSKAVEEERRGLPPSSSAVRSLKSFVKATRKHVTGTNENRVATRSKIHGMTLMLNPPNIWMTVTCDDVNDPLVQLYAGANISLDNFNALLGPDNRQRLKTSTQNPVAATKFFFRMMNLLLEKILGISVSQNGSIDRQRGVLGYVNGYVGIVEAQNRGTLHLHTLLWLCGSPSASEMISKLQDESFRQQLELFISRNIRSHVPGLNSNYMSNETPAQRKFHKQMASAYSKPIQPFTTDFSERHRQLEFSLARTLQVHKCQVGTCLVPDRYNRIRCKRRAPWDLSAQEIVYSSGLWFAKRDYPFLNTWHRIVLFALRSNSDMKLLTNAADTRHITFYNTNYAAKSQDKFFHATALLSSRFAYIHRNLKDENDLRKKNKRLLTQCAHSLNQHQELSCPQMVSYILGYGDKLLSHRFVPIHLSGALWVLEHTFPEFRSRHETYISSTSRSAEASDTFSSYCLQMTPNGLHIKSQLTDYIWRGDELESFSFLNFLLESYEPRGQYEVEWCRHQRVPYKEESPHHKDRLRILRRHDACMIPDFLGTWIPRNDRPEEYDFYCASVLLVLKPWRKLENLIMGYASWPHAFHDFLSTTHSQNIRLIENFQFYYQSSDAARQKAIDEEHHFADNVTADNDDADNLPLAPGIVSDQNGCFTLDLDAIADLTESVGEAYHGLDAMCLAESFGIFSREDDNWDIGSLPYQRADINLLLRNIQWQEQLQNLATTEDDKDPATSSLPGSSIVLFDRLNQDPTLSSSITTQEQASSNVFFTDTLPSLTFDQRRACYIVEKHLTDQLSGRHQSPLLMMICGSGGVGKSTVIRSIQHIFRSKGAADRLAITATSGVASSHINGTTVHWWAGIPVPLPKCTNFTEKSSSAVRRRRENNIANKHYLILDEVSMLCLETLGVLSHIIGRYHSSAFDATLPFGGNFSVILIGDFHQFPPPLRNHLALYKSGRDIPKRSSSWLITGSEALDRFQTVVLLTEQKRVVDDVWSAIMERIRYGDCTASDIREIQKLVLNEDKNNIPDFSIPPWSDAVLVTPRHGVRTRWNIASVKKFARLNNKQLLVCPSEHLFSNGQSIDPIENPDVHLAIAREDKKLFKILPRKVYLTVGLRILITFNVCVNADLANGSRGTITDIFLDPREPPISSSSSVHELKYPPKLIYFKPDSTNISAFPGLAQGIIPVEPSQRRFKISLTDGGSATVLRRQYPITPAYCFTDYKAQGQTIRPVILDLRTPPSGTLSQFNLYVALSRGVSREYTRILTCPENELFTTPPDEDLQLFDTRLKNLNQQNLQTFV